jgi:hypothetical protein
MSCRYPGCPEPELPPDVQASIEGRGYCVDHASAFIQIWIQIQRTVQMARAYARDRRPHLPKT